MCICELLYVYVCMCTVCIRCIYGSQKSVLAEQTVVSHPLWYWELDLGPLHEQLSHLSSPGIEALAVEKPSPLLDTLPSSSLSHNDGTRPCHAFNL